ncbi:unnamed protein product [Sympodiomycopsis kandeliae]
MEVMSASQASEGFSPTEWQHVDSLAVLDYFAPLPERQDPIPVPTSQSATIIDSLFEAAELTHGSYPPTSWDSLSSLVEEIQSSTVFDTLKKNGLLLYLLLDYHLLPSGQFDVSQLRPDDRKFKIPAEAIPQIDGFMNDNLIPDFWRLSIHRGYWQLDKGMHKEAIPWLDDTNSLPYASHIILTLANRTSDHYSRDSSRLILDYYRVIHKPSSLAISQSTYPQDTLKAILIAKATIEGLRGAVHFLRSQLVASEANSLWSHLWAWLFNLKDSAQIELIKSLAWLPLSPKEISSLTNFSLGQGTASVESRGKPCSLALDTLLVRLINSGMTPEALKINAIADQRPEVYAISEGDEAMDQNFVLKKRKRSEMLRLAKDMLPDVLRSQLEVLSIDKADHRRGQASNQHSQQDASMDFNDSQTSQTPADAAPISADNSQRSLKPGYLSAGRRQAEPSAPSTPLPPRAADFAGPSKPLPSQSPFASASASQRAQLSASTSFSRSNLSGAQNKDGPYARLAAQIQSQKGSNALRSGKEEQMSVDESQLLSSLLPQKRSISAQKRAEIDPSQNTEMEVDDGQGEFDERNATTAPTPASSNFEMPKRRYTKKDDVEGAAKKKKAASAKAAPGSSARAPKASTSTRGTRIKTSKTMPSMTAVSEPRAVARFPEDDQAEDDNLESTKRSTATRSAKGKQSRATRAGSESVPGAFPGQHIDDAGKGADEQAQDEADADADQSHGSNTGVLEMTEVPRRRGVLTTRPSRTATGAVSEESQPEAPTTRSGRATRRSTRATTAELPMASTPARRSTRGHSRASSVASSPYDDSEGEEETEEYSAPITRRRSTASRRGSDDGNTKKSRGMTRSESMNSVSDAGTIEEEEEEDGGGDDGDETPRGAIKTRSGRTVRKRVL